MGKTNKKNMLEGIFLSGDVREKVERKARREADIEFGIKPYGTKVHKSQKAYSRKGKFKNQEW